MQRTDLTRIIPKAPIGANHMTRYANEEGEWGGSVPYGARVVLGPPAVDPKSRSIMVLSSGGVPMQYARPLGGVDPAVSLFTVGQWQEQAKNVSFLGALAPSANNLGAD